MKYEDKKTLVLAVLMIVILGFFSYRNFQNIVLPERTQPPIQIPDIEFPSIEEMTDIDTINRMLPGNDLNPNEFTYINHNLTDKITFQYPSHWTKSDVKILEGYREIMKPLFMAFSKEIPPTMIIGLKLISQPDTESAIEAMKSVLQQEGVIMNVIDKTPSDNGAYFSAEYLYDGGERMLSKERIILIDKDAYIISVFGSKPLTDEKRLQMDYIINSIQIM